MYNNKKGQAALEFLMTYGWAILAAIIVIGALGSYFYFNQAGRDTVYVNAPFGTLASGINATHVTIEIENRGSQDLRAVNITVGSCTMVEIGDMASSDAAQIVAITCPNSGSSYKGDITLAYLTPGSSYPQSTTGSISGPVD